MSLGRQYIQPAIQERIREVGYVITHQEVASLKVLLKRNKMLLEAVEKRAGRDMAKTARVTVLEQVLQNIEMMNAVLERVKVPPDERSGIDLEAEYPVLEEINREIRFKKLL